MPTVRYACTYSGSEAQIAALPAADRAAVTALADSFMADDTEIWENFWCEPLDPDTRAVLYRRALSDAFETARRAGTIGSA